ncbi:MAG TPA: hypothetical protein VL549_13385 [Gemmatimonadales bacterium]|jgi:hypothetical protein|nr:hypothetical protein [Gemmatimonadales bacterium]
MRKLFGGMVFAAVVLALPSMAQAQRRSSTMSMGGAKHELGVDLGVAFVSPNYTGGSSGINIQTPLDVRFGFVPKAGSKMMWEPRLSFTFSTINGTTTYIMAPQLNALFANSTGGHKQGMYFTGGAGLVLGDLGGGSGTALKLEGGIGWRKPYESAAWRYEVGVQYVTSSTELGPFADYIAIGGRIGISLWH